MDFNIITYEFIKIHSKIYLFILSKEYVCSSSEAAGRKLSALPGEAQLVEHYPAK